MPAAAQGQRSKLFDPYDAHQRVIAVLVPRFGFSVAELDVSTWLFDVENLNHGSKGAKVSIPKDVQGGEIRMTPAEFLQLFDFPSQVLKRPHLLVRSSNSPTRHMAAVATVNHVFVCQSRTEQIARFGARAFRKQHSNFKAQRSC